MKSRIFARVIVLVLIVGLVGVIGLADTESSVMVDEVAWAGTQASWADEWIELKNTGEKAINLEGWELSWEGVTVRLGGEKENTLSVKNKTIKPGGVFLLERTDDETVSTVQADVIFKGSLANSGEKLVLKNPQGDTVDTVDSREGWMAGTSSDGDPGCASMVFLKGEWKTRRSKGIEKDAEGNSIIGTPGYLSEQK